MMGEVMGLDGQTLKTQCDALGPGDMVKGIPTRGSWHVNMLAAFM